MKIFHLFVILLPFTLQAQETVDLNTNPPSVKWQQVNTPSFRILYPEGFDKQAQRMANTLETLHAPEARTMGRKPRKISLILQNRSAESNGFVTLTPRRSEFYTMSPQDYNFLGNNDWLDLLATHEYRHIVQFQNANRGFNRIVYWIFGNNALSAMASVAAPFWFWEGDAVAVETAFTASGRGRIPCFNLAFHSNLNEGRIFDYHKQSLRSYKHFIPNHYVLGYNLVSYVRKRTGDPHIWEKITARTWNVPFIPFRFSSSVKKETGMYLTDLYKEMAHDLVKEYQQNLKGVSITEFKNLTVNRKDYTNYQYPHEAGENTLVSLKSGIGDIEQAVITSGKEEKLLFTPGQINPSGRWSYNNRRMAWTEYRYDPRWQARSYSVVMTYDLDTKKIKRISSRTRYAGAALSPDGSKVVTVESNTDYQNKIVILDFENGQILHTLPVENGFVSMPVWDEDGKNIIALKTFKSNKNLVIYSVSGEEKIIAKFKTENIGYPVSYGSYILYNSPVTGIDNVFAVDRKTGTRFQLTSSRYGAYNPSVSKDGKTLYYNDQSADGLDIVSIPFEPENWKPYTPRPVSNVADILAQQEGHGNIPDSVSHQNYPAKKYARIRGIINPYAWGPLMTSTLAQASLGVYSQDLLSTATLFAGYNYDIYSRTGGWGATVSYAGLYPIIDVSANYTHRQVSDTWPQKNPWENRTVDLSWNESTLTAGVRVPWQLTSSRYFTYFTPGNKWGITQTSSFSNKVKDADGNLIRESADRISEIAPGRYYSYNDKVSGILYTNSTSLAFSRTLKRSYRDFLYRWGQVIDLEYYTTVGGKYKGEQLAARSTFFFPGLMKHHFFYARVNYQKSFNSAELGTYYFANHIFRPRGYSYTRDSEFIALSANYSLPLWYPDIHAGPLLNVQRVKVNAFLDYGVGSGTGYYYLPIRGTDGFFVNPVDRSSTCLSFGAELTFDINVLRFLPQLELGVRLTNRRENAFNDGGAGVEFLLGSIGF